MYLWSSHCVKGLGLGLVLHNNNKHMNNKMDCSGTINTLYKKGQSRLFLLKKLRSFGVQWALLRICGGIRHIFWCGVLEQQHHGFLIYIHFDILFFIWCC